MANAQTTRPISPDKVRTAVSRLAKYELHERLLRAGEDEAHRILPLIWPVIEELCTIADACKAEMIEVKA